MMLFCYNQFIMLQFYHAPICTICVISLGFGFGFPDDFKLNETLSINSHITAVYCSLPWCNLLKSLFIWQNCYFQKQNTKFLLTDTSFVQRRQFLMKTSVVVNIYNGTAIWLSSWVLLGRVLFWNFCVKVL